MRCAGLWKIGSPTTHSALALCWTALSTARSMSSGVRASSTCNVTPNWRAAAGPSDDSSAVATSLLGLIRVAIRVAFGTASFKSSSPLPMNPPGTSVAMPVTLPPGRARLATKPTRTGSATAMKTIGMVDVAFFAARLGCGAKATISSGFSATNSCASTGKRSTCPPAARKSMRRLRPSTQPARRNSSRNTSTPGAPSQREEQSTPMCATLSVRCAATIGDAAIRPPAITASRMHRTAT